MRSFAGLSFAAGFRRAVVVVAGVGGDPVVGAVLVVRLALARCVALFPYTPLFRSFGRRRALAFFVFVELPGDRAAGGRAEQAGDRGLVLEHAADVGRADG